MHSIQTNTCDNIQTARNAEAFIHYTWINIARQILRTSLITARSPLRPRRGCSSPQRPATSSVLPSAHTGITLVT